MSKGMELDNGETWPDESTSTIWSRKSGEREFVLVRRRGQPIDQRWSTRDAALAVGCAISHEHADGGSENFPACFPASFQFSPNTGKPLEKSQALRASWLPPYGNESLRVGLVRGGKLTDASLQLSAESISDSSGPPLQISLPAPGHYRFLVGAHGLQRPTLMALDWINGMIWCWLPQVSQWAEVTPSPGAVFLGSDSIADETWNIDCNDLASESTLYWPCEKGLAVVRIDPLTLTYEAQLVISGHCVSQPVILNAHVYVLICAEGRQGVALAEIAIQATPVVTWRIEDIPESDWHVVATPNEVIWISSRGQVVASTRRQQFEYVQWEPSTIKPEFVLGPPHCARDGRLWMQVLHPSGHDGEEGPGFVSLGRAKFEWQPTAGARTLSGKSSIKVEQRLMEDPWIEPTVVSTAGHDNNEAVVPVLESVTDGSILVLRVNHADGIARFFERDELLLTRFQIMGQHADDKGFFQVRLRTPWKATAFLYDGTLYLYHPEIDYLPGWPLASGPLAN